MLTLRRYVNYGLKKELMSIPMKKINWFRNNMNEEHNVGANNHFIGMINTSYIDNSNSFLCNFVDYNYWVAKHNEMNMSSTFTIEHMIHLSR